TPTYSSWLNQVELWFAKIQRDVNSRGVFTSVADLARKLRKYIAAYTQSARPFRWTYTDPQKRIRINEITGTAYYDLLFRWFVGLEMDDEGWDVTVFTKNRERLIQGEVSQQLLSAVLVEAREKQLLSAEHFTVEGTLIQAWAASGSLQEKSDPPAPGQGSGHGGEVLRRDKVESKTDPEA